MRVLVSDTSILIDLERADLLRAAFSLDAEFVVPDLMYERAQAYRCDHPRLALPDTFALTLAKSRRWLLLTGDGALRALSVVE